MIDQDLFDWMLLLGRWIHITVAVTWVGTSFFFMWLDRTLVKNEESTKEGHVGELWMVHGGGFYHVEKVLMGPTKVPKILHWFKWESYWTWMSGVFLVAMIFYTGNGTFLLDSTVSDITYLQGVGIGIFSILGSWVFYDFLWEREFTKTSPVIGHILTLSWFVGMSYFLCHTLSGRAAYIHIGGMLGTWMTANVFMRIIPRQLLMVEASRQGEPVNKAWGLNAKNRSTHNTYFSLPVIFIMLSNHFPATYGHEYNWVVLLIIAAGGAAIREYFIKREHNEKRAKIMALLGIVLIVSAISFTKEERIEEKDDYQNYYDEKVIDDTSINSKKSKEVDSSTSSSMNLTTSNVLFGVVHFKGNVPKGKKLRLPRACSSQYKGDVYSNEVIVNDGKLKNVLVHITKGIDASRYTKIPKEEVQVDQKGCLYIPRVSIARVGQKVTFVNSDPVFHNVKSVTKENKKFNIAMPKQNQRKTRVFTKSEIFLQTKCSVHPWMGSYIAVVDHPFSAVTNSKGEYKIMNLPDGDYTVEFWHEIYGTKTQEISINNQELNIEESFKK
jgi:uncharacterized membrane protein/plastocyanin